MKQRISRQLTITIILFTLCWGGYNAWAAVPVEQEASAISGTVYYVAPTGNNSNPGTESQPWRTIQKAANTLVAGDTVYIKAGTYRENVVTQNSGSAGNYIMYSANPGDTVTIDGTGITLPETTGLFDIANKNYIRVFGLRVMNAGPNRNNKGILIKRSSHIVIESNYIYNTGSAGIRVWQSDDITISNNEVEQACQNDSEEAISVEGTDVFQIRYNHVHHSEKEGIDAKNGSSNGKIFGNYVHHTDKVGIYVDAWETHTYNLEIFGNIAHSISASGFAAASEQGGLLENVKIYNNIAYNNEGVGLHLFKTNHLIRNIQIVNNTFYDNGLGWGGGIFINNSRVDDILIRNNILSQNLTFQIAAAEGVSMDNLTIDHNLIDGYRGADGEIYGSDYVQGDPLFVNPAGLDFHLQHGSPAIDQGSPIDAPATDFDGSPRPSMTGGYDIGAFEHPYGFNMAADLPAQAIQAGESAVYTLQVSAVGEFDTPVALAHSPAPSGLLLSLEPATVAPGNAATLMLSDLHTGTLLPGLAHTISITGVGDGLVVNETVHLIVGGVRFYLPIIIGE